MNWDILVVAGIFEVGWAIVLKYTEGFTRLWPSVWTVLAMIISLGLLGIAMKTLPVGTAYSVWVGVGAVGTVGCAKARMSLLDKVVTRRAAGWRAFARLRVRQGGLVTRLNCLRWCQSAVQAASQGSR